MYYRVTIDVKKWPGDEHGFTASQPPRIERRSGEVRDRRAVWRQRKRDTVRIGELVTLWKANRLGGGGRNACQQQDGHGAEWRLAGVPPDHHPGAPGAWGRLHHEGVRGGAGSPGLGPQVGGEPGRRGAARGVDVEGAVDQRVQCARQVGPDRGDRRRAGSRG